MSEYSRETTIEKEFSPESAGERVGWVLIERAHEDFVAVNIATATVEEEGAVLSKIVKSGGEQLLSPDNAKGFSEARGLQLLIDDREGVEERIRDAQGIATSGRSLDDISPDFVLSGRWAIGNSEERKWTEGRDALTNAIKEGLGAVDASEYYPYVYYNLNGHIGHPSYYRLNYNPLDSDTRQRLFFPDPDMLPTTQEEIRIANSTIEALESENEHDKKMLGNLTVFSEVKPEDLPKVFEESRIAVAGLERVVMHSRKAHFGRFVYLPIGFRPQGRSWPYMDASLAVDDERSFGRELDALKNKSIEPAQSELKHERNELVHRITYAR